MSDVTYEQAIIRAQLSILSNPPVAPIDINTTLAPQFWRAAGIAIQVGVFDGANVGLDFSNLSYMELSLQPSPTSLVPWMTKTVVAEDIASPIEYGDWLDGLTENASFVLDPADTDLGLLAGESRQFWMSITGFTEDGNFIVYGAGYVTIYNPGNTLPPRTAAGLVSYHSQVSTTGNFSVTPTSIAHTEKVTVAGSAGTRNAVLQAPGYPKGSGVDVILIFDDPTVAGIVVNLYSNAISGDPILSYTTDGFQTSALLRVFVNEAVAYEAKELIAPAFPTP